MYIQNIAMFNVVYNSMIKFLLQYAQRLNILGGLFFWSVYLRIYTKLYKKYTTYLVTLKVKVENCITRKFIVRLQVQG